MSKSIVLPIKTIKKEEWIIVNFTNSIKFRAIDIKKKKDKVSEPNNHRFDEATAETSIKFTAQKCWDLTRYLSNLS